MPELAPRRSAGSTEYVYKLFNLSLATINGIQLSNCDMALMPCGQEDARVLFWIIAIGICLISAVLILWPMMRRAPGAGGADPLHDHPDVLVYRDQLKELDAEIARGVIPAEEAEISRAEIGRRLLAAAKNAAPDAAYAPQARTALAIPAIIAAMAFGAIGIYASIGAPGQPDQPLAARDTSGPARPDQTRAEELVADAMRAEERTPTPRDAELLDQLRAVLETRRDPRGFLILAETLASLNKFAEAARAAGEVIALKGDAATAADYATHAELMIFAARGYVSPEAEAALAQSLQRDMTDRRARYYSGVALAQGQKPDLALNLWQGLLAEGPADAPWKEPIRAQIRELAAASGIAPPDSALSGPSSADIAAAEDMAPEDRMEMIRGMVTTLEDRLATEGGTPEEWARLIRSLTVLGETERATTIAAEARMTFAGNDAALAIIDGAGQ